MRSLASLVLLICLVGSQPVQAAEQQVAALLVEDALSTHSFGQYSPAQISPDGKWAAYVVVDNRRTVSLAQANHLQTGIAKPPFAGDVCLTDMGSGATQCPTNGKDNNWAPVWSQDGRYLAFLSDRDGSGQAKIWIWEAANGQLRKLSDVSVRANDIRWLRDSKRLVVTVLPQKITPAEYARRVLGPESVRSGMNDRAGSTVLVYRSAATAENDRKEAQSPQSSLEPYLRDLAVIEVGSGLVRRFDRGHRVAKYIPSPDGSHVAFTSPKRFADSATQQIIFDLVIVDLRTGKKQTAASDIAFDYDGASFSWSPDGSRLGFQTSGMQGSGACYVVDANGISPPRKVSESLGPSPYKAAAPVWDTNGRNIYFINGGAFWRAAADGGKTVELSKIAGHRILQLVAGPDDRIWTTDEGKSIVVMTRADATRSSGFYSINLETGRSSILLEDDRCFTCGVQERWVGVVPGVQKLVFFAEDERHDMELWVTDPGFEHPRQLTHLNPQLEKYDMGASRLIEWQSLDGEKLEGALLLPAGYLPGKRYPLIINVYGGALHSNRLRYFGLGYGGIDNMQLFATRGYAVLLPDAPQHLGTPMLDLVKTVLPGVNKVIEMGIADPERLGVMGHSYGGYSTLSLIVQTTRFKAAVVADGTGDLVAGYGEMDKDGSTYFVSILENGQGLMGGAPWQYRERYIDNSPIFYLDRVETPLLIVHGAEDKAVASFLGDEIFVGLRRLGKETEYAKYEGEDHSPLYWSYPNQLDYCTRLITWFDKYLKGITR